MLSPRWNEGLVRARPSTFRPGRIRRVTVRSTRWVPHGGPISRVVRYSRCRLAGRRRRAESGASWAVGRARVFSPRVRTNRSAHAGRFVYSTGSTDPVYRTRRAQTPERTGTPSCAFRNAKRALSGIARVSRWPKVGSTRVAGRPGSRTVQTPPGAASRPRSGSLPGRVRRAPRREIAAAMLIARWLVEAVAWRGAALVRGRRRSPRRASWRW
jgi:hypothetical protein